MLLQQQSDDEGLEATRVTSQELARALAAIEARRHERAEREVDTIALGEAIRQLGLDVTAEELMAEVRAQRQAENSTNIAETAPVVRRATRRLTLTRALAIALPAFVAALAFAHLLSRPHPRIGPATWAPTAYSLTASPPRPIRLVRQGATVLEALSSGRSVSLGLDTIHDLNEGMSPMDMLADEAGRRGDWQVRSVRGKLHVSGWRGRIRDGRMRLWARLPTDVMSPDLAVPAAAVAGRRPTALGEVLGGQPYHETLVPIDRFRGIRDPVASDALGNEAVDVPAD